MLIKEDILGASARPTNSRRSSEMTRNEGMFARKNGAVNSGIGATWSGRSESYTLEVKRGGTLLYGLPSSGTHPSLERTGIPGHSPGSRKEKGLECFVLKIVAGVWKWGSQGRFGIIRILRECSKVRNISVLDYSIGIRAVIEYYI